MQQSIGHVTEYSQRQFFTNVAIKQQMGVLTLE